MKLRIACLLFSSALVLGLAACDREAEEPAAETEVEQLREALPDGQVSREELLAEHPMLDPEERAARIERMRERRAASGERLRAMRAEGEGEGGPFPGRNLDRPRFRNDDPEAAMDRRGSQRRSVWWEDEATAEKLGLTEAQTAELGAAREGIASTLQESRARLAEVATGLNSAISSGDRASMERLLEARLEAQHLRQQAELEWMSSVLAALTDEQLLRLAEEDRRLFNEMISPPR